MRSMATLFFIALTVHAQTPAKDEQLGILKKQAQQVARAMTTDNHDKLIDLTHPKVVELLGGRKKMVQVLEQTSKQLRSAWPTIRVKVNEPTGIVEAKDECYGAVPFIMEMERQGQRGTMFSVLIGVSSDQGKKWVFIDAGGKERAQIRQVLPNLPNDLRLPDPQKPKYETID